VIFEILMIVVIFHCNHKNQMEHGSDFFCTFAVMNNSEKQAFRQVVYDIVRLIPAGRATSYGAIARAVGFPNLSRMVGKAMSQCPCGAKIPAHRVVNSQGFLSAKNAFGISGEMQQRLEAEGVVVKNDKIQKWKTVFWNPTTELLRMEN
jgi:methylated-DNA-protein-cysteine methyltransferase-like protein